MLLNGNKIQEQKDYIDPKKFIALEEELISLKQQYGIEEKRKWWMRIGDYIAERSDKEKVSVDRKKYIILAVSCGWFCGAHRFYSKQKILGVLYFLLCWTGISFAMTLIDLMIVLPMKPDEHGKIQL